jgi:light-regulated signal transduction histidine kinase (bacteriophytochrome)
MASLIDDLLALSRVTRGEFARGKVDLSALARDIAGRLVRAAPDRAVDVVVADGLEADCDGRLLAIVFENLLGNAWKFTAKRTDARIEVGASDKDSRIFFVRDNGAGFDMAYATKLFGMFQRLHSTKEFEGTGIGLATVKRVIRRHRGRIWAESEVGCGATFYFTLEGASDASIVSQDWEQADPPSPIGAAA